VAYQRCLITERSRSLESIVNQTRVDLEQIGSYGGAGGTAGQWAAETLAITSGMTTITGSVGAGGTAGASVSTEKGGTGGTGRAFFYF
jgi:hypothetical protein